MSLLDLITGGKSSDASNQEKNAVAAYNNLVTPTAAQLTLPELEQYVQQGILTPQQAQAFLVKSNALDQTSAANSGLTEEQNTLAGLQDVINQGGNDAQFKADIQTAENALGTAEGGANKAALEDQARRGTANSGLTLAALLSGDQNAATNANTNATNAAAAGEQRQLQALTGAGSLGGAVQGQEYTADLNKANAANAIAQFNANQGQNVNLTNTATNNEAAKENLANKQATSNANVLSKQTQQESEVAAQQQAYEDALQKASGVAGASENQAANSTEQGQQLAGTIGGLISAGGQAASAAMGVPSIPGAAPGSMAANGGSPAPAGVSPYAHGGEINMKSGGPVPGTPNVPHVDTEKNDTVPAMLSPHEVVIPQSIAEHRDPKEIMNFVRSLPPVEKPSVHPKAALDMLRTLDLHHRGA